MSDPAVTNLSPDGLNAQARICLEGSVIVLKQELVDICHSLILPSASTDSKEMKIPHCTTIEGLCQNNILCDLALFK